ncbi:exodeoxyribonuclease VII large subunit [Caldalkalibacillus salinus]|uniref:exodeoxyribonuclease VII large subunit n=1 Tax=Caldalkalibacillus salinus TaxID=2803787 RepID=UPI001923C619|nr:exodeoxyribonuclease VII large subunit [Caldalkalibacillus salinus]
MDQQHILTVRELTHQVKHLIERESSLRNVWVRAEISNFTHHSRGHMYFTLKDEYSRVRTVMFAGHNRYLKFMPQNGMKVLVRGEVNVYERDGQYQLLAKEMQPDGIGALYQAYEQLKQKLEQRGWFDENKKKPIPKFPKRIGVITSKTGAAIRDILITITRRFPIAEIVIFPVNVQGEYAPKSIADAIGRAQTTGQLDVLIVGRGGGSIEELWAFNEEIVATAIHHSHVPVISAVGHETDFTIADFVADLRAPTPTAAAELAVPVLTELREKVQQARTSLKRSLMLSLEQKRQRLEAIGNRYAFRYPQRLIQEKEQELDHKIMRLEQAIRQQQLSKQLQLQHSKRALIQMNPQAQLKQAARDHIRLRQQLEKEMERHLIRKREQLNWQLSKLEAYSPLKIMTKGYSLIYNQSKETLYRSVKDIEEGQKVKVRMQDGELDCQVRDKKEVSQHE